MKLFILQNGKLVYMHYQHVASYLVRCSDAYLFCSVFDNNIGGSGAIIDFSFQSGIFYNSIFSNSIGSVIRVSLILIFVLKTPSNLTIYLFKAIGSKIIFNGNISFINNNAEGFDGGAIYMLTFSQMILNPGAHLIFVNNTGGYVTK